MRKRRLPKQVAHEKKPAPIASFERHGRRLSVRPPARLGPVLNHRRVILLLCPKRHRLPGLHPTSEAEKAEFLKQIAYRTEVVTNAEATAKDCILTLVTCMSGVSSDYWIVHAVPTDE